MKIALFQIKIDLGEVLLNLNKLESQFASDLDVDIIVLPELFASGSVMVKREKEVIEKEKKELAAYFPRIRDCLKKWAEQQNALIMGSAVYEEEGKYYNRLILAFPDGEVKYYDKRHCFRMGGENEHFTPGNEQMIFDYKGVKIAAFICYDLRFPVWSRNTSDYELAIYVANWPASRGEVWKTLLKARAIENQCYVVGVNCVGEDKFGTVYTGNSVLLNARGEIIAKAEEEKEEIIKGEISKEELSKFRQKFNVLQDRDNFILQ